MNLQLRLKKGISLVLCVSVMMILSVMAVTFVRMMTYEQAASTNYVAVVDARFTALAGIERAKAVMWQDLLQNGKITTSNFWYPHDYDDAEYNVEVASQTNANLSLKASGNLGVYSYSGIVGGMFVNAGAISPNRKGRYEINGNFYALKILTSQGKLNVHSHNTGKNTSAQEKANQRQSNLVMNNLIRNLAVFCEINDTIQDTDSKTDAERIADAIRPVDTNLPPQYTSMGELWALIKDNCKKTTDNNDLKKKALHSNLTLSSWMDSNTQAFYKNISSQKATLLKPPLSEYGTYYAEARSPVEINLASEALISALIANIKFSAFMYNYGTQTVSESTYSKQTGAETLKSESAIVPDLWRLVGEFNKNNASGKNIANEIAKKIYARIHPSGTTFVPFKHTGEFEAWVDALTSSDFPVPNDTTATPYPSKKITNNNGAVTNVNWVTASNTQTNTSYNPYKNQWVQVCRDAIKANFNPNVNINFWNPNQYAYREITKAELYTVANENNASVSITPGYSTDGTFFSQGYVEITALGRVTNEIATKTIASAIVRTSVKMCDVCTHTTQNQFIDGAESSTTFSTGASLSYPEVAGTYKNAQVGWIEPKTQLQSARTVDGISYSKMMEVHNEDDEHGFFGKELDPPANISKVKKLLDTTDLGGYRMINGTKPSAPRSMDAAYTPPPVGGVTPPPGPPTNFLPDGVLSKDQMYLQGGSHQPRYLAVNTIAEPGHSSKIGQLSKNRSTSSDNIYNISSGKKSRLGNYSGAIEFWAKFDVPPDAEINCGILGWTQISEEFTGNQRMKKNADNSITFEPYNYREGTQTYLFKTANGKLRLSRMYFAGYFSKDGTYYGCYDPEKCDTNRKRPKRDIVVDLVTGNNKNIFAAHTWHHFIITWNDTKTNVNESLRIYIDGEEKSAIPYWLGQENKGEFCILNECAPETFANQSSSRDMDGLFIGGFYRQQKSTNQDGMTFRYSDVIHNVGNVTIDGLRTYNATNGTISSFTPTRFSNSSYTGVINIPYEGILGPIFWNAYPYPTQTPPAGLSNADIPYVLCKADIAETSTSSYVESHSKPTSSDPGYNGEGLAPKKDGSGNVKNIAIQNGAKLKYTIDFTSRSGQGKGSRCASFDSVSVLVMRSSTKSVEYLSNEN